MKNSKDTVKIKDSVIRLENINKVYETGSNDTVALVDIDMKVERGEFVAIMGPSGSGKSTLMNIIGLLDRPTSGKYFLDGQDVSKIKGNKLALIRNQQIGFVFQQFNLLARTTALDNILLPSFYGSVEDPQDRAKMLLEQVGLQDRAMHKSNQLSGGQLQRVAIARALMMNPSIILADEPTGNLDSKSGKEIMHLFKKINEDGVTIILITHEDEVAEYADRKINIRDGKIVKEDPSLK